MHGTYKIITPKRTNINNKHVERARNNSLLLFNYVLKWTNKTDYQQTSAKMFEIYMQFSFQKFAQFIENV